MKNSIQKTRKNFSFAWSRFAKNEVNRGWHKDSYSYLVNIPEEIFKGADKIGLDVGCGSGADMRYVSRYGARIVGIDISDSIRFAGENIAGEQRLHLVQANVYDLPFKDEIFDFAYSFGVLHHLPDPEAGFKQLCAKVKTAGYVIIYVYEDFSDRSIFERVLLKIANLPRVITPKLPPPVLYLLCILMSPVVFLFCSLPYQIFRRIKWTKGFAEKIPFKHTMRLDCLVSDLYDRFSPPIEYRYNREEVRKWFERAGLGEININYYRGWVAWGKKK